MHWTRRIAKSAGDTGFFLSPVLWLALLMIGLHLAGLRNALLLESDNVFSAQPWRLVGAHFVHWSDWHLLMNVAGLAIWPLLCDARWSLLRWLLVFGTSGEHEQQSGSVVHLIDRWGRLRLRRGLEIYLLRALELRHAVPLI